MKRNPSQSQSPLASLSSSEQKQLSKVFNQQLLDSNLQKQNSSLLDSYQNKISRFFYSFDAETSNKINNLFTYLPIEQQIQTCKQVQQLRNNYDAFTLFIVIGAILAPRKLLSKGLSGIAALAIKSNVGDRIIQFKVYEASMNQNKHNDMLQEMRNVLMFYGEELMKGKDGEAHEPVRKMLEVMEGRTRDHDIYKKNRDLL